MNDPGQTSSRRRLVIVGLKGGLGNQMFQYALGRYLAERHGRELLVDESPLHGEAPTRRSYHLHVFGIEPPRLDATQMRGAPVVASILERKRPFCAEVLAPVAIDHIFLLGFWQDERYFIGARDTIRSAFQVKDELWLDTRWRAMIATSPAAVCVHVRRQDYLTQAGAHVGFVGLPYYDRAISLMAAQVTGAHFFVFSDDLAWCRENLRVPHPHTFVEHPREPADATALDLALMMRCRHFVIANSSFSWWAAWLGAAPDKTVIAPKQWYQIDPSDPGPPPRDWIRV